MTTILVLQTNPVGVELFPNTVSIKLNGHLLVTWLKTICYKIPQQIGHFRVPFCLCFKASLSAKPLLWKWLWFAWKWNCVGEFIFTRKGSHENSFCNRGTRGIGNGLLALRVTPDISGQCVSFACFPQTVVLGRVSSLIDLENNSTAQFYWQKTDLSGLGHWRLKTSSDFAGHLLIAGVLVFICCASSNLDLLTILRFFVLQLHAQATKNTVTVVIQVWLALKHAGMS